MFALILFAVISLGGCGGSGSTAGSGGRGGGVDRDDPTLTMNRIWNNQEAAQEIVNCLTSEDIVKLLFVNMDEIERQDDGSLTMRHRNIAESVLGNAVATAVSYDKEELLRHYESEDIIVLLEADLDLINAVHANLGLPAEDENFVGPSEKLEAYGLARIETGGLKNYFRYVVPKLDDLVSSDVETNDEDADYIESEDQTPDYDENHNEDVKPEVLPQPTTLWDFQIDRWVRFLQWMGNIATKALENQAKAAEYEARAADGPVEEVDLAKLATAQNEKVDTSVYYNETIWGYTFPVDRVSTLTYDIYSAHSFTNGKDYYLVNLEALTNPRGFLDTYIDHPTEPTKNLKYHANFLCGYTRAVEFEHHIDDGKMSNDDVSLSHHAPVKFNKKETQSNSETWTLEGTIGFSGKSGTGEVGYGKSHTNDLSWEVSEFEIKDQCETDYRASAKWLIDMNLPKDGAKHEEKTDYGHRWWWGVNARDASKSVRDDHYAWLWTVGKGYWQNHPSKRMSIVFKSTDGFTYGKIKVEDTVVWNTPTRDRYDDSWTVTLQRSFWLVQPPHVVAYVEDIQTKEKSQYFPVIESKGTTTDKNFFFLCNSDWTISSDSDWCHISSEQTSGSDTGDAARSILVRVDPYQYQFSKNGLKGREAVITVSEDRKSSAKGNVIGKIGDKATVIVQQSAPHILVDKREINADIAGGEMSFNLLSDSDWTVVSDKDWCKIKETSSAGGKTGDDTPRTITFTVASAWGIDKADERQAVITATHSNSDETVKIYVKQPQTIFEVSQTSFTVDPKGGEMSFTLFCDKGWTVESNQDWCVINATDKSGGDTGSKGRKITFTVPDALAGGFNGTRNAVITVTKPSTSESLKIEVEQSMT